MNEQNPSPQPNEQNQTPNQSQPLRNRVKEVKRLKAADVAPNAKNFRLHSDYQRQQLRAVLGEVGYSGVSLAYYSERNGGKLTLLDGHLRQEEVGPDFELDVAILDVADSEADKILLSYDWLGSLATIDDVKLKTLATEIDAKTDEARLLIAEMLDAAEESETVTPDKIDFKEYDENAEQSVKYFECPACGAKSPR